MTLVLTVSERERELLYVAVNWMATNLDYARDNELEPEGFWITDDKMIPNPTQEEMDDLIKIVL